jgi:hypothetical protein
LLGKYSLPSWQMDIEREGLKSYPEDSKEKIRQ